MQGHGFNPWSGTILDAMGQLILCTGEPVLCYKKSNRTEKPAHYSEDRAQPKIK